MSSAHPAKVPVQSLPNMNDALPQPPPIVCSDPKALEVWNFINDQYSQLNLLKAGQVMSTNKARVAIAPALLLGFRVIVKVAKCRIEDVEPGYFEAKKISANPVVTQWLKVIDAAYTRFQRWTSAPPPGTTRDDPNNNQAVMNMIRRYQTSDEHWWVAIADDSTRVLYDALRQYNEVPGFQPPINFLEDKYGDVPGNYEYVLKVLDLLTSYVALTPEARTSMILSPGDVRRDVNRMLAAQKAARNV